MKNKQNNQSFGQIVRKLLRTTQAFTLVEILSVILIISILVALALPKYQKSLNLAKASEIPPNLKALQQAINVYVEERGYLAGQFLGKDKNKKLSIDLSLPDCPKEAYFVCSSDYKYKAYCSSSECEINIYGIKGTPSIISKKQSGKVKWTLSCSPAEHEVCKYLQNSKKQ